MKFSCDQCGTRYSIADEKVERKILKIRCKVCQFVMVVRGSDRTNDSMGSLSDQFRPPPEVEWYVAIAGQQHGPMPVERVRELVQEGQLSKSDLVWNENLTEWQEASGVPAIAALFAKLAPATPPPLPDVGPPPVPQIPSIPPAAVEPAPAAPASHLIESAPESPDTNEPETAQSLSGSLLESLGDDPSTSESSAPAEILRARPISDTNTLAYGSQDASPRSPIATDDEMTLLEDGASLVSQLMGDQEDPDELALADTGQAPEVGESPGPTFPDPPTAADVEDDPPAVSINEPLFPIGAPPQPEITDEETALDVSLTESGPLDLADEPQHQIQVKAPTPLNIGDAPALDRPLPAQAGLFPAATTPETASTPVVQTSTPSALDAATEVPEVVPAEPVAAVRPTAPPTAKKTSMGLVVTLSMCAAAALFCVVWFGMRGEAPAPQSRGEKTSKTAPVAKTPKTSAETPTVIPAATGPKTTAPTSTGQAAAGAPSAESGRTQADTTTTANTEKSVKAVGGQDRTVRADAGVVTEQPDTNAQRKGGDSKPLAAKTDTEKVKPRAQKKNSQKSTRKKTSRRAEKTKRKKRGSDLVATSAGAKTKAGSARRRSSLFSGGPSPSSVLPTATRKEEDKAAGLTDGLNQAEVVKVISQYKKGLDGCYQRQLKREPLRDGRLMLKFRIRPSGRTSNVSIGRKYDGTVLKSCLDALVRRWRFPQFRGEPIDIEYPLIFATRF